MNLVLFNFESDKNSQALAFALDWINEIAKNVDKLYVISLRCGEYKVDDNVKVYCINQNKKNKIQTIFSIWNVLRQIHNKDKKIGGYFVHMAHYFVPFIYPFAKYYNQKIVLWYAHKSVSFTLRIANLFIDRAVASTSVGYQIKTKKLKIIGQGIDNNRFLLKNDFRDKIKNIVTVGRVSKIKNVDMVVEAFLSLKRDDLYLHIVGDALVGDDIEYLNIIKQSIPKKHEKNIIFIGSVSFEKLPAIYKDMDLAINISDTGSLDKTIIEPMAMGIPVITSNDSAKEIFNHLDEKGIYLLDKKEGLKDKLKKMISEKCDFSRVGLRDEIIRNHSLDNLVKKIVSEFK